MLRRNMNSLGVWIVGAAGHVGACTLIGWAGLRAGLLPPVGMATSAPPLDAAPLMGFDPVFFGGHETTERTLTDAARALVAERILPAAVVDAAPVQAAIAAAEAECRPGVTVGTAAELKRVRAELASFRDRHGVARVVVLNVASTEPDPGGAPPPTDPAALWAALEAGQTLSPSTIYAAAAIDLGFAYVNFTPSTGGDLPALHALAIQRGAVIAGADGKTGQTLLKTVLAPMFKARYLGVAGWYSTNILGNRDGEVLDDPESFKTKEESKLGVLEHILQPKLYPDLYGNIFHKVRINYYPPRGDNKEGWDNIDIFGWLGYPMQIKVDFLCRDSILAAPIVLDLALFMDLAHRSGMRGTQEWLSFYFKSPMTAPGLYPEHDLFIQMMKLKNTLRHLKGEELITHLGQEYYD